MPRSDADLPERGIHDAYFKRLLGEPEAAAMVSGREGGESMSEVIELFKKRGRDEGRAEGKAEGKSEPLLRLLRRRFGDLPGPMTKRIARADLALLENGSTGRSTRGTSMRCSWMTSGAEPQGALQGRA